MNRVKKIERMVPKKFLGEDKVIKFSDFKPTKYNGNQIVASIMEWLRVYSEGKQDIIVSLDKFLKETNIDKNMLLTFIDEMNRTGKVENFKISIDDNNIKFYDFKNVQKDRIWEENN